MQYGSKNISKVQYGSKNIIAAYWGSKKVWENVPLEDLTENYCTIEALEDGLTVSFSTNSLLYSLDNGNSWTELPADNTTPAINSGDMISFKATGLTPNISNGIGTFRVNKKFNLKGNVMSMLFGDEGKNSYDLTGYNYAFVGLFDNCSTLQSVSKDFLPATTLSDFCYADMFGGCTSLTTAPDLPSTRLALNCYTNMFRDCTSLTQAPELPATTLVMSCYSYMFRGCTSLFTAPELSATTLANSCYQNMFEGCTSLTQAPELPATTLFNSCYGCMFAGCSSMTTSPVLPATTLSNLCYADMFAGTNTLPDCTNIDFTSESVVASGGLRGLFSRTNVTDEDLYNILPINQSTGKYWLPATTLTNGCYNAMFAGCTSLVTSPELPATTLAEYCYQYMFSDCTSLVTAPELPATTLVYNCYYNMFSGCTSLNYIKALFTTTPSSSYTRNWVNGVSNTGTFVKNADATWDVIGVNGIPEGWTVETYPNL